MTDHAGSKGRKVFVTVGTTRFEKLVNAALSPTALTWMESQGYTCLVVQYGTGQEPTVPDTRPESLSIQTYKFKPSLDEDMQQADLILSHAGAGTVMETLRLKKRLVVIINTLLMDNHQTELASAMAERGHLYVVERPELLDDPETWKSFQNFDPVPHKGGDPLDFPRLLDAHLGFIKAD